MEKYIIQKQILITTINSVFHILTTVYQLLLTSVYHS